MMGAIGTGNTRPGMVTASFGTSGTIYACAANQWWIPKEKLPPFAIPPISGCPCCAR